MLRILTLFAALLLAGAASATQTLYVNAPEDGGLNLRTGPSTAYRILTEMPHGSRVTVFDHAGKWVELRHQSGATGWAHSGWLSAHRPAPLEPRLQKRFVSAPRHGALNLREGPGTAYRVVKTMPHGSSVELLGGDGSWLFVRHASGKLGWAHAKYLTTSRPAARRHKAPPRRAARPRDQAHPLAACHGRTEAELYRCLALMMAQIARER